MMNRNKLVYFRRVIYKLSKDHGFKLDLYRATEITNYRTGRRETSLVKWHIKKALVLPNRMYREYNYLGFNNANQQVGGVFDIHERRIIINKRELPRGHVIEENDYIVFNHHRYELKDISDMELVDFWHLTTRRIEGHPANEIHEHTVRDRLEFQDQINVS